MADLQEKVQIVPATSATIAEQSSQPAQNPPTSSYPQTSLTIPASPLPPQDGRTKARTDKQKQATQKMKEVRAEKRKSPAQEESPGKGEEEGKSMAMATAMFMDMRKKEKEAKKEHSWEKNLNYLMTNRMDEFEERLVNMFSEPIDHFLSRRKPKKQKVEEAPGSKEKAEPAPSAKDHPITPQKKKSYSSVSNPFSRR